MSDDTQQPIVVKRIKKGGGGAHGGAWKIAYADFVTAMMAFFLLMWLLGSTAQGDLEGIADYFQNPIKMSMAGGDGTGDSSSVIPGGGEDLTRSVGQVRRGDVENTRSINMDAAGGKRKSDAEISAQQLAERKERARLIDLKGRLDAMIEANASLRQFKNQILMDITTEGLRIQLVDEQNRPMFMSSSAELRPYTRDLLREIARALNDVDHRISLSGHTDSSQYAGGERGFSNWELSSNRANASRRELVAGGLEAGKMVRVVGLADTIPLNRDDPYDPVNRRISIIVLNKSTEEAIRSQTSTAGIDVKSGDGEAIGEQIGNAAPAEQVAAPFGGVGGLIQGLPPPPPR
ncbi:flagellar motor protein MotB [Thauera linaloolentis]|uniref:OmpA/MotB domain-containing protein n=1 Tax=Thauera linaloolentis (strain DSM 12138 / JCM 21573 / CCUG 41526 / CIP 105981 / IAM 15112 / NBRC 102519 / 47Lol) TaxID=1123367 RepID=N6YYP5_THAL4|nr:flagellar motor protein MotB [Thauera linaloolentis]ENO87502.1 OmpA/MotB domain-containing protein [Thauera linaloolentis 47Lol = DSM 12138]MCM8565533.1 flagellar motor protein MotB [Thauera linaloolentis]